MTTLRVRYAKWGKVQFLSHRDLARVVERAIRRAGVPVAYSQGFSPRPKLHFGLALPTGYESDAEFLDLDLAPDRPGVREPAALAAALQPCLPQGVTVTAVAALAPGEPSLQDAVTSSSWVAHVDGDPADLAAGAEALLAAGSHTIEIVRKGKQVREDLRPLLLGLDVSAPGESITTGAELRFELGTKPRSVRPAELLAELGIARPRRVRRTHQWINSDRRRREPLEASATSPRAEARAS
jgi:radical SAM-linked protein